MLGYSTNDRFVEGLLGLRLLFIEGLLGIAVRGCWRWLGSYFAGTRAHPVGTKDPDTANPTCIRCTLT